MHAEEFNRVLDEQIDRCRTTLGAKASEYADDTDRLQNFKTAAAVRGVTPVQALGGMMVKHTVSIYDMLESTAEYPDELWDEKIGDHLNYLFLLKALLEEAKKDRAALSPNTDEGTKRIFEPAMYVNMTVSEAAERLSQQNL